MLAALFALGAAATGAAAWAEASAVTNYWTTPAEVKVVDDALLASLIDERADGETRITETINGTSTSYTPARETYSPADRQWQGLPSVARTGDRLWAVWYTGGNGEPRQFNYLVIAYSDDGGANWVDPFLIVDHADPEHTGVNTGVPNFWVDEEGDLCLTYIQYYTWIIRFHDADAAGRQHGHDDRIRGGGGGHAYRHDQDLCLRRRRSDMAAARLPAFGRAQQQAISRIADRADGGRNAPARQQAGKGQRRRHRMRLFL